MFIYHRLFVCLFLGKKEIYTEKCAHILRSPIKISILFHLFLCFDLIWDFFFFLMQQAFIAKEQKLPVVCLQCWDHTHVDGNTIWSPSSKKKTLKKNQMYEHKTSSKYSTVLVSAWKIQVQIGDFKSRSSLVRHVGTRPVFVLVDVKSKTHFKCFYICLFVCLLVLTITRYFPVLPIVLHRVHLSNKYLLSERERKVCQAANQQSRQAIS